jgi:hypothetical protein
MTAYVHVDGHQNLGKVLCLHLRDKIFRQKIWTCRKTDYIVIMISIFGTRFKALTQNFQNDTETGLEEQKCGLAQTLS